MVSSSVDPEASSNADSASTSRQVGTAATIDKYIEPGQTAPRLRIGDKILLGLRDAASPSAAVGWLVVAGYSQAKNGSPNYGTTPTAFAQRFGAAAARDGSEGIFTDAVMAPILHEDPRYYRMGRGNNFFKRASYAVSRTFVTRTDSGRSTPNFALLSGNLEASFLTKAYYPDLNTTNTEVLKTYGGSLGGSAVGFLVSEFFGSINLFHKNN